jgi:hypothetical protein
MGCVGDLQTPEVVAGTKPLDTVIIVFCELELELEHAVKTVANIKNKVTYLKSLNMYII